MKDLIRNKLGHLPTLLQRPHFLLGNIYERFGNTIYRQSFGILIGKNSALLIADLFVSCHESPLMAKLKKTFQIRI